MLIDGRTEVIAHLGYPTHAFKAPMIYNPYFERAGINALVVPMACRAADFAERVPGCEPVKCLRACHGVDAVVGNRN